MSGGDLEGEGAPARAVGEQPAPALLTKRRLWIALVGAALMALAGALAGTMVKPEGLAYPSMSGPRLRTSPVRAFTPASLSRERSPNPGLG